MNETPPIEQKPTSATPAASTSPQAPAPAPQPESQKKRMLIGIAAAAVLLIATTLIVLFLTVFNGPSKADYTKALSAAKQTRTTYRSLTSSTTAIARMSSYDTPAGIDTKYNRVKQDLDAFKQSQDDLKGQKAYRDKDVNAAYEAYDAQQKKFVVFADDLLESYKPIARLSVTCESAGRNMSVSTSQPEKAVELFDEKTADCRKAVTAAKDVKNETLAKLGSRYGTFITDVRKSVVKAVDAINAKDRTKHSAALREIRLATSSLSTDANKLSREMVESGKDSDVVKELNALGAVLADKANGKK